MAFRMTMRPCRAVPLALVLLSVLVVPAMGLEHCGKVDDANTASLIAFAVIAVLSVLLSVIGIGGLVLSCKLDEKMRESETHLHQVMDATLCALLPALVLPEMNAVADESQAQTRKPTPGSEKPTSNKQAAPATDKPAGEKQPGDASTSKKKE